MLRRPFAVAHRNRRLVPDQPIEQAEVIIACVRIEPARIQPLNKYFKLALNNIIEGLTHSLYVLNRAEDDAAFMIIENISSI